jgi:hypothetical protein
MLMQNDSRLDDVSNEGYLSDEAAAYGLRPFAEWKFIEAPPFGVAAAYMTYPSDEVDRPAHFESRVCS